MATKGDNRKTFYACLIYPTEEYYKKIMSDMGEDSSKFYDGSKGWGTFDEKAFNVLEQSFVNTLISPLHFADIDSEGKYKKPHFHCLFKWDSKKAYDTQIKPFFDSFGGVALPTEITSYQGYARYLCHLDVKQNQLNVKPRYKSCYVTELSGADYDKAVHIASDDKTILVQIFQFIREYNIVSMAHFLDICINYNLDWFNFVTCQKAFIIDKYMKSLAWEIGQDKEKYVRHLQCSDEGRLYYLDDNHNKIYLEE